MSSTLMNFASRLTERLAKYRQTAELADDFGTKLQSSLRQIEAEFLKQNPSPDNAKCPLSTLAGIKIASEEINRTVLCSKLSVHSRFSTAFIWINHVPGTIVFEIKKSYTPEIGFTKMAVLDFGLIDVTESATTGPNPAKATTQTWTMDSNWLTDSITTTLVVSADMLATKILDRMTVIDINADMENASARRN